MHLHSSLALTVQGVPLGFLDAQCWACDPDEFGRRAKRHALPIEDKESWRWIKSYQAVAQVQRRNPQLTLVSMGDREADIYELFAQVFAQALHEPGGPKLLVRAKHNREVQDEQERLFETIQAEPLAGYQHVKLPRQKTRPAREAKLAIRFATVTLCAPQEKSHLPRLEVQMVLAQEQDAPEGAEPIEWRLLTTVAVASFEQACEKVDWYTQRGGIEVFHRTLKSGCRIEDRKLGHADRLEACLAIDMVVAWRIYHLTKLGREVPDLPAEVFFDEDECKVLLAYQNKTKSKSKKQDRSVQAQSLREAIRLVARLGGFLGRNSDGEPGTETLWRGPQRLDSLTEGWRLASDP